MPSAGRGLSNNRTNEDMKSTLRFQVLSCDWRSGERFFYSTCLRIRKWRGCVALGNHGHTVLGRKKKLRSRHDYSSTQRAMLLRSHLSCGIKQRPSAATPQSTSWALTPRASCLLLFPFWSLSKGTFLVRWWLRNQSVTQWQEFTIKFISTVASHKLTGLVKWFLVFSEKEAPRSCTWIKTN